MRKEEDIEGLAQYIVANPPHKIYDVNPLWSQIDDYHLSAVIAYIPVNPVKAGWVQDQGAWRYSSARLAEATK